jgi:serine/threonine protein kinase
VENENSAKYFQREIEVMYRMTHPSTLPLIGYSLPRPDRASGLIVMEFIPNGTMEDLNKAVYKRAPPAWWTPTAKSKAVLGITAGMAFVHTLDILHRDLKPANVFIDGRHEVRVADFGRSRVAAASDLTIACGTPLTQAPEALESDVYTNKIDVYSYAMCLYMMFRPADALDDGGTKPKTAIAMMRRIASGARYVRDPAMPDFYWRLIQNCWAQNPDERPAFIQILRNLRDDRAWVFEGTDAAELAEYEARVLAGLPLDGAGAFEPGRPETAAPTVVVAPVEQPNPPWFKRCILL